MKNLIRSEPTLTVIALVMVITLSIPLAVLTLRPQVAHAAATQTRTLNTASTTNNHPICSKNGQKVEVSTGGQMWCKGPQSSSPSSSASRTSATSSSSNPSFGSNVDAANPLEDVTPNGVPVHGQSEVSVAASGPFVVEAWNDGTGFFSPCPSALNKEELTGFGFSADGGKSFVDEGGLPNANCSVDRLFGDPSVAAWQSGGQTFFYISSLFLPFFFFGGPTNIAINACPATGVSISCSQPIIAATSTECQTFFGFTFCSFLDKEFLSIDPVHGRLYVSYTDFGFDNAGVIELAVCDIGTPGGGAGPLGGTAGAPVCQNGSQVAPAPSYLTVAPGDPNFCENEGAYPAVDLATGDVYVGYEHNWASNIFAGLFGGPCATIPTQNVMNFIPFSCLTLPTASCSGPATIQRVNVTSLDAAFIPGYNRFPMNDFPRLAVSGPAGTVSMVWNDTRQHATGDIFLQSFNLGSSLSIVQSSPVRINSHTDTGGWLFLPAVRNADGSGNLDVSFYSRSSANTALTNVNASLKVDPRTTRTPTRADTRITTGSSDWNAVSSIIIPNFGDYTDNYFLGTTLFVAWSEGRLGFPQPFEDHVSVH